MERLVLALVLAVVVAGVAVVLRRRKPDAPTQGPGWTAPEQVDRHDFASPSAPWLVAVFTSATCGSCADVARKASVLASKEVAVDEVEVTQQRELHQRYRIEAVPITVVADTDGVVQASFIGPVTATDLWAAVARLRDPSLPVPEGGCQRDADPHQPTV